MEETISLRDLLYARRELPPPELRLALRTAAGATQSVVAAEVEKRSGLSMTRAAVRHWEKGARRPSGARLVAYVEVLHLLRDATTPPSNDDGNAAVTSATGVGFRVQR